MTTRVYEASVFTRTVNYRNFKGEERSVELHFALDPLKLLKVIAGFKPKTVKSGNPARRDSVEVSDEDQIQFVRNVCIQAAGEPSNDGEAWEPFPDFEDTIAGQAFLTKLASSDGDRKEFAEKVIIAPFRAYVEFASEDPTNTPKDVAQFKTMLAQVENIFAGGPEKSDESYEDRRARLEAELAQLRPADETPES
jgi:hypothetical protein